VPTKVSSAPISSGPPSATCTPTWSLVDASEFTFNPKNTPFKAVLPCAVLDVNNFTVLANFIPVLGTSNTTSSITIPGFAQDFVFLTIAALDIRGNGFFATFELLFGSIDMPVLVLGADGNPAPGVVVQANTTTYVDVGETGITDSEGKYTFKNLISTTIGLVARDSKNEIGINGIAATTSLVTVHLMPFNMPSNITNYDFSNGTTGWSGGKLVPHVEKRDSDLSVSTNFLPDLQTASATFKTFKIPLTKTAFIRYKFQTDEVPGGYFGTQYNDYFSITMRSDKGAYTSSTNSMNALGLGAFDGSGATQWYTLELDVEGADAVQFDIGVSNVADALYQSQVIVDKTGDLTCDKCGDCSTCPGHPMCQASCQNPPLMSCAFYGICLEAALRCGAGGYPIRYGQRNCNKFQNNRKLFSPAGETWIWAVMHCLQTSLVAPATTACDPNTACSMIETTAFSSHAPCYVNNGFCSLSGRDYAAVLWTVGGDLANLEAIKEAGQTANLCIQNAITAVEQEIANDLAKVVNAIVEAEVIALRIVKKFYEDILLPH
jgi:hypothetical protein